MHAFEIDAQKQQQLLDEGYTILPGTLPAELLQRWRDLAARLEREALEGFQRDEPVQHACVVDFPAGPQLIRFDDLHAVDPDAVLDLLACPAMMAVARDLCGEGAVPLVVDVLYKHQHPSTVIAWHQGAPHPRGYPYLNIGIYLDDAPQDDGCLRYVPGSQHELQDICGLSAEHGWDIPGTVQQPAEAGDILIQDMMILHGSEPKRSPGVRRTVYVEIRTDAGITESDRQSPRYMELRRRWMALVVRRAGPGHWPREWCDKLPDDLGSDADELAAIAALPEPAIPAVYCPHPSERDDYPVPADLREPTT